MEPAITFGCSQCMPADPGQAWGTKHLKTAALAEESHFVASLLRCRVCGQDMLYLFVEEIDWEDGDDPQAWMIAPLTADEAESLRQMAGRVDDGTINAMNLSRRHLERIMPKGGGGEPRWIDGPVLVLPHD